MEEEDPAEVAAAAAAAAAAATAAASSSSSRASGGGGRGASYHGGGGGYPSTFGHSSLYASLLGSMSGHQLSGFTHHGSLQHTHSGQALDLVESDSDEEYMYTVGNGDGLHSDDESDEESGDESDEEEEDDEDKDEENAEDAEDEVLAEAEEEEEAAEEARVPLLVGRRSEGTACTSTLRADAPVFRPSQPPATSTGASSSSDPTAHKQQGDQGPGEISPQSVTTALLGA